MAEIQRTPTEREFALARGAAHRCPACGRDVEVVLGFWMQHSDPKTWPKDVAITQCRNARRPYCEDGA